MTHAHVTYRGAVRVPLTGRLDPRVLLLGEDNPQSGSPEYSLFPSPPGCAGHRLCYRVLDLCRHAYFAAWRTNLCNPTWSRSDARERAHELLSDPLAPWRVVVMLGRKVAEACAHPALPLDPFTARTIGGLVLVSLPHPSGRCQVWNDRQNEVRARALVYACAPQLFEVGACEDPS